MRVIRQSVNLRTADGAAALGYADLDQRRAFLERRDAARRAQATQYAVGLSEQLQLPDGTVLPSLAPVSPDALVQAYGAVGLRLFHEGLRSGVITERYDWPPSSPPEAA